MKKGYNNIIRFLRNSWPLKPVLIAAGLYLGVSLLSGEQVTFSEIVITFLISLYLIWGYGKKPKRPNY
jgi:hypothetical protein